MHPSKTAAVVGALAVLLLTGSVHAAANPPTGNEAVGNCGDTTHGPGCSDAACAACVCDQEPSCCSQDWDNTCLSAALSCPAECFAVVGNCGDPRPEAGCSDALCEACVCNDWALPSCCTTEWDEGCAQAADGVLGDNTTCQPVCLLANRTEPAPALSWPGLTAALLALGGVAWRQRRRRAQR